jgi:hypothetical protein
MDGSIARSMVEVIRAEKDRLLAQLEHVDPEFRYEQWEVDEPFINELSLLLLVALWHHVERQLVHNAVGVAAQGKVLDRKAYQQFVENERKLFRGQRQQTTSKLNLNAIPLWQSSMTALRLLVNCYKHDAWTGPDHELLKHLGMDLVPQERLLIGYASFPESRYFREGLARYLGLPTDADYCAIAEKFVSETDSFLTQVEAQPGVPKVQRAPISLAEFVG